MGFLLAKIMSKLNDYIKANRKGSREAELSFENGWKSRHKVHKSKRMYSRKEKHAYRVEY